MVVGLCTVEIYLDGAMSLKEKRQILKSVLEKIKRRFNVSAAELDQHDLWQRSTVAFACVSNSSRRSHQILSAVIEFLEKHGRIQIISCQIEML